MRSIHRVDKSLDKVLSFFDSFGIDLKKRPNLNVVDLARNASIDSYGKLRRIFQHRAETLLRPIESVDSELWARLSYAWKFKADIAKLCPENFSEAGYKISLDKQFLKKSRVAFIESILSHEVWHLVEMERGLDLKTPLIMEGTASYVQGFYSQSISGSDCDFDDGDFLAKIAPLLDDDYERLKYFFGAKAVWTNLKGCENKLSAILDLNTRRKMEKNLAELYIEHVKESRSKLSLH